MSGLIPFNRKNNELITGFDEFRNMLDDFFSDGFMSPGRSLLRDTFKIDVKESDNEYLVEAEVPGVKKDQIDLSVTDDSLRISINKEDEINDENESYVHRERRTSSMSRNIRLANAETDKIKAKLKDGILTIKVPKAAEVNNSRKINIE